ncbi:MAG: N-acetylglucosamine-6-phosphate deacetylase [Drouetiella hepatica Uher 2000/2452]|jgi:N-acetylglucosamine-6-phosphate deacetylase|uniref:N-acetylglucosamine-6-phosphate deacetylase n=1 Tax=Drouetiella hepatica Uher 2000/2452 TaxID=904376 RepID=A0A951QJG4_9CYAN|nr:N-acetylglucosamine-6-phosphate deacetylase [Drouetiella hepatica Uher 2000/2452]
MDALSTYALVNGTIYTGDRPLHDHALVIEGDKISALVALKDFDLNLPTIDLSGSSVAPGFIDMQLNGCGGVMFNDAIAPATLDIMHQTNLKSGTTSYLPTLITTSDQDMLTAMEVVKAYRQTHPQSVLGLHLEGPYLNPKRKGIHNADHIRPIDRSMLEKIVAAGREVVRLVTIAPELAIAEDIKLLTGRGIIASAGHTDASYEEAIAGFDAGVQMATHLFNAMSPWQGRKPGMVGAIFDREEVYAGLIADGQHVHGASMRLAKKLKQDKLILVTDATPPVGAEMESFAIGGQQVFYKNGRCVSADGTLGGSALTMIEAIAHCVNHLDIPLPEALRMASTYPAKLMGLDRLGQIAPGYVANLAIFDRNFQIVGMVDQGHYLGGI